MMRNMSCPTRSARTISAPTTTGTIRPTTTDSKGSTEAWKLLITPSAASRTNFADTFSAALSGPKLRAAFQS